MQAYEAIKKLKVDRKEFLEQHGLKSHMSKIPKELEAELFGDEKKIKTEPEQTQTVDSAEAVVVGSQSADTIIEKTRECPYTKEQVAKSIRLAGNKSVCWKWRNILDG